MSNKLICFVCLVFLLSLAGSAKGVEGLLGEYYEWNTATPWENLLMKRLDPTVNFNWAANSPDPAVPVDGFMVRWTGQVEAPATATYTFHTQTDDGVRLWVNNVQLIDNWTDHSNTHNSGDIKLTAGQRYDIRLEYYENGGDAVCQLSWSTSTMARVAIQSQYLWVGGARPDPRYPDPADGAIVKDTWVSLSWSRGDFGASDNVYVGDNYDDVEAGTGDTFRINLTETTYAVGFGDYPYPEGLIKGKTYYWRIEDIEADGVTTHSGPVWSFSIAPATAYGPTPADCAEAVDPNIVLRWTAGFGALLHTVYFGDDYNTVNNAAGGMLQGATTKTPGPLDLGKTYYWRVDEFFGAVTEKGEVWGFSTPGAVGSPNPYNGAVNVKQTTILTWVASDNADSHQVYFGTDEDAVRNATTTSPEYKGSKNLDNEKYDPGQLAMDTTYYWRIDEVEGSNTQKGNVWTFTTADYLVVDDWEAYNDIDPPSPASNTIFAYWMDGWSNPNVNGALIGYDPPQPSYTELTVVHGGRQSMPYEYDIDGKYAEASLTLISPRNWTASDVKTLTIWFHGNLVNDAAPIYVTIANTTGTPVTVTHEDPSATQIHAWTKWDIPLQTFADQGINLTDVNSIILGIGNKTNPPGGAGNVYFDDIGLHPLPEPEPEPTP
jgi:hypothetical protein